MVTPKSVVETTPLVVARIEQLERARHFRTRSSGHARTERRDPRPLVRLVPAP